MTVPKPPQRPRLVLASTSPWRAELLARLGLPFESVNPQLDETPWMEGGLAPRDLVVQLAAAKAAAVADSFPQALVLGADQVASVDDTILGKPGSRSAAIDQLLLLQGRSHELVTGLALHDTRSGEVHSTLDVHRITLRSLDRAAVENYVDREDVLSCAGSYRIEGLGICLFESVEGLDYTGVIGLPITQVTRLLVEAGLDPLD